MAREHKAYDSGLATAVRRAAAENAAMSVYYDGCAIFVRDAKAAAPKGARLVCIAERWDPETVQVRFAGAHSEFVKVGAK
jgi:hypothetical protein